MAKQKRGWIVTPHGPLQQIDDNLWTVEGAVPGIPMMRRMSIIRKTDGTLVFFNAIPLDDATLEKVKSLGKPRFLVVGHHAHVLDAHAFQQKLELETYGPAACEAKLRERVELAGTLESFPNDVTVSAESVPGTKLGETFMTVRGAGRTTLLFSDLIQNNPEESTVLPFRILGFAGGPKVVWVFRKFFVRDRKLLKSTLENWAKLSGLHRLVPFHGSIVESEVVGALRGAAASLK